MAAAAPRNAFFFYSALLLLLAVFYRHSSCASAQAVPNVTDVLTKAGNFNTFLKLAGTANVTQALQGLLDRGAANATAFIPVDSAFTDDIVKAYGNLSAVNQSLVLYYHVIPKFYNVTEVVNLRNVSTLATTISNSSSPNAFHLVAVNQSSSTNVTTVYGNYNSANVINSTTLNATTFPIAIHPINAVLLPTEIFGAAATNTTTVKAPAPSPPSSSAHHTAAHATTLFISLSVLLLSFHLISLA